VALPTPTILPCELVAPHVCRERLACLQHPHHIEEPLQEFRIVAAAFNVALELRGSFDMLHSSMDETNALKDSVLTSGRRSASRASLMAARVAGLGLSDFWVKSPEASSLSSNARARLLCAL